MVSPTVRSTPALNVGTNICRCAACGEIFAGVTNFEEHRAGPPRSRYCRDPAWIIGKDRKSRLRRDERGIWRRSARRIDHLEDRA